MGLLLYLSVLNKLIAPVNTAIKYEIVGSVLCAGYAPMASKAGKVGITRDKGKLRLYWSWDGRQRYLSTGLEDSDINRKVAEQLRLRIEVDLATGNYDPTLAKYDDRKRKQTQLSAYHLMQRFIEYKRPNVDPRTLEKYIAAMGYLKTVFGMQRRADGISTADALRLRDYLLSPEKGLGMSPRTIRERIGLLKSCWKWGAQQVPPPVTENPWENVTVLGRPKQKPQPFTREETEAILKAFKGSPYYHFVWAWFSTGMRTGEIRALLWRHIDSTGNIWIGESLAKGNRRKSAKRYRDRTISPPKALRRWLLDNRGEDSELVFAGPNGAPIDEHNFSQRHWKAALKAAGVPYRRPYNMRHTFITGLVNQRWEITRIAEVAGTSYKMILENYLGGTLEQVDLPELDL